jgi:hypothetical protein
MMRAARDAAHEEAARRSRPAPLVIAVTMLTSLDQEALTEIGLTASVAAQVERLAALTEAAGLDGVVASPQEIAIIRRRCGPDFTIVTPGIRGSGDAKGDQSRTLSAATRLRRRELPAVGRPIIGQLIPAQPLNASPLNAAARPGSSSRLRPGCHFATMKRRPARDVRQLCEPVEEIDISTDPALEARYGLEIPVLLVDGKKAAKYRVTEGELTRLLAARNR